VVFCIAGGLLNCSIRGEPFVVHGERERLPGWMNHDCLASVEALSQSYTGRILYGRRDQGPRSTLVERGSAADLLAAGEALYLPDLSEVPGQDCADSGSVARTASRRPGERPADAMRALPPACARYCAVSFPTNPVAPYTAGVEFAACRGRQLTVSDTMPRLRPSALSARRSETRWPPAPPESCYQPRCG